MNRWSSAISVVDGDMIVTIISRLDLKKIGDSEAMYGGTCPMCGKERSFTIWADKAIYRCFWCGLDGRFVISPERRAELRRLDKLRRSPGEEIA